jgi:hypothetical protein
MGKKHKDILDKLIYLDPDFISSKYEEIKKVPPTTQITKTEGMKADGGLPFLSAGVHSQESKTFKLSSNQMLKDIYEELELYPTFEPANFGNYQGTQIAWLKGQLTLGNWKGKDAPESSAYWLYEIDSENAHYSLITQTQYFSPGFGSLLSIDTVLRNFIGIPVKVLARLLYSVNDVESFVACPYLIMEP